MGTKPRTGYGRLRMTVEHAPDYFCTDALQYFQTVAFSRRTSYASKKFKIRSLMAHTIVAYSRRLHGHFINAESGMLTRTM